MFCTSCTEDITILNSGINNRQGNQEKISFLIFSKTTQLGQKLIYIVGFDSHVDQHKVKQFKSLPLYKLFNCLLQAQKQ